MSEAKVRGIVHLIDETKTYGTKGFRKRMVVLEQDQGGYTNYIPLDFIRDGCDTVDELNVGDEIEVSYQLSGRRWQKDADSEVKFFLNAEAMGFKLRGGKDVSHEGSPSDLSAANDALAETADDDDDIPF